MLLSAIFSAILGVVGHTLVYISAKDACVGGAFILGFVNECILKESITLKKQLQIPPWFSFVNLERAAKYCEILRALETTALSSPISTDKPNQTF